MTPLERQLGLTPTEIRRLAARGLLVPARPVVGSAPSIPGRMRPTAKPVRRCRVCACTDGDCRFCIERTGSACSWVPGERDLCTACLTGPDLEAIRPARIVRSTTEPSITIETEHFLSRNPQPLDP